MRSTPSPAEILRTMKEELRPRLRLISAGEGVERTFQTYSPLIASVEVKRKGDVRRAKLYYLRERSGKSARIRERTGGGEEGAAEE